VDGYLKYVSNYVKVLNSEIGDLTDLKILRDHLAGDDITWKDYKLNCYQEVENNLQYITYFDKDEVTKQFKEVFIVDGKK